jgi:magnesium chelatase subunit D
MDQKYRPPVFPFSALVGQELLKAALLLNAVNPNISGVLVRGDKGTAKSTAVRALAALLPELEEVSDCPCHCSPSDLTRMCADCLARLQAGEKLPVQKSRVRVVDLPLNATEDRLVGSIDFEHALKTGKKKFLHGILAEANRGIIYIDEVNLLEDHLVDILLDTAVTGINIVEREGVSFCHPSRYILIATMNPEEGEIRPQLLDRFGLCVTVTGMNDAVSRVVIAKLREEFDNDSEAFMARWRPVEDRVREKIIKGRELLPQVGISGAQLEQITMITLRNLASGHRADLLMEKTSRTIAALEGRDKVTDEDIKLAAGLVLAHRARTVVEMEQEQKREAAASETEEQAGLEETESKQSGESQGKPSRARQKKQEGEQGATERPPQPNPMNADDISGRGQDPGQDQVFKIGAPVNISTKDIRFARDTLKRNQSGRRTRSRTSNRTGRYVRATSQRLNDDIALDATLRAAAPFQRSRRKSRLAVRIEEPDIREKIRMKKTSNLLLFVVDASGSMGTRLMTETKGAIFALLLEAYQKRDKVGLIAFRGMKSELLLPPTNSIELAKKCLEELPTGGKTPLGHGLLSAYQVLSRELGRESNLLPLMIVVTDGRANVGLYQDKYYEGPQFGDIYREIYEICELIRHEQRVRSLVIDAEEKRLGSFGRSKKLAQALKAKYFILEELAKDGILKTIERELK